MLEPSVVKVLPIRVGDRWFAIAALTVEEVVAGSAPAPLGVLSRTPGIGLVPWRRRAIAAIDLRSPEAIAASPRASRLVVVRHGDLSIAIAADAVMEVRDEAGDLPTLDPQTLVEGVRT